MNEALVVGEYCDCCAYESARDGLDAGERPAAPREEVLESCVVSERLGVCWLWAPL